MIELEALNLCFQLLLYIYDMISGMSRADVKNVLLIMHIWNSVSMTTGKKYNSPKSNWKNHLQPITNKYCDELGLSIMPAEYSRNPKNISRDKWEREMSMKEIILRDAKMCAYAAGNVEHFQYLMKRL